LQSTLDKLCKASYTKCKACFAEKGGVVLKSRIGELRKRNKISQEELAMAVGVTRQTITSLECEKYTASLVLAYRIARYFDTTIEEIFDFSEVEEIFTLPKMMSVANLSAPK
jgi:putative transcriptional regulator